MMRILILFAFFMQKLCGIPYARTVTSPSKVRSSQSPTGSVGIVTDMLTSEITETQFKDIERRQLDAVEWGKECFGIIRVPLFRSRAIQHHFYVVYV